MNGAIQRLHPTALQRRGRLLPHSGPAALSSRAAAAAAPRTPKPCGSVLFCALLLVGAARNVLPSHLRRAGYPIPVEHDVAPLQLGVIALEEPLHSVDAGLLE